MCKKIVSNMDKLKGDKRTVNYLLMNYCSFNSCIYSKNNLYISGLNGNIFLKNQCHIFTENYKQKLQDLQKILKNVNIKNKDYKLILKNCKKGDFVFLDPPYIEEKKYLFDYDKKTEFNLLELVKELDILTKKGVKFMMTQIDTNQVRNLFGKYKIKIYNNDSNYRGKRTDKKEVIITNY
jgi:site-specific DNA-adenine methylase